MFRVVVVCSMLGCTWCPEGCDCIGYGRCIPLPGYWAFTETSGPVKCKYSKACPGVKYSQTNANTIIDTQKCIQGYNGIGCSACEENYYMLNDRCYSCGAEV